MRFIPAMRSVRPMLNWLLKFGSPEMKKINQNDQNHFQANNQSPKSVRKIPNNIGIPWSLGWFSIENFSDFFFENFQEFFQNYWIRILRPQPGRMGTAWTNIILTSWGQGSFQSIAMNNHWDPSMSFNWVAWFNLNRLCARQKSRWTDDKTLESRAFWNCSSEWKLQFEIFQAKSYPAMWSECLGDRALG